MYNYFLQLLNDKSDINAEQLLDIGYLMGQPTKILFYADNKFVELKAQLKPPYLNIVGSFDIYTWLGVIMSYIFVCLCHCIIMWLGNQDANTVFLAIQRF